MEAGAPAEYQPMSRPIVHPRFLPATAGTLGRGGPVGDWVRQRYTGDGIGQARVPTSASVSVWAWKQSDLALPIAPATPVSNNGWWVGALPDIDLAGDDVLTSVADPAVSLILIGPADDVLPGMQLWRANQQ